MGRIYQRRPGGPYYGYWTDGKGKHHRKALHTGDATVARARLRQLELVSTDAPTFGRHSLGQAIKDLLEVVAHGNADGTWSSYKQKGANLVEVIGNIDCSELTRESALAYVRHRKSEGAGDSTVHKELVVLRRSLAEAQNRNLWRGDPRTVVPSIKVRYVPRRRWLNAKQANALLGELAGSRRLWAALACWGGLCLGEIERLRWEHVDIQAGVIRVPGTKRASRQRSVPIAPDLAGMLRFAGKKKGPTEHVVSKWPNVRRDLAAAVARANAKAATAAARRKRKLPVPMPIVSPNDLRRTFASWLKQRGIDSFTVAKLLGHSSSKMVELVYGQLDDATYERAIAVLPRAA